MKQWTVYCHTHIATGRMYFGVTSRTMDSRWSDHCYAAKRNAKGGRWHFPNAIRLYGSGSDIWKHDVIRVFDTVDQANLAEKCLIKHFGTRDPSKGFNLAHGGHHKPHPIRKNPWNDPEYRAKCTLASQARASDPNVQQQISTKAKDIWNNKNYENAVVEGLRQRYADPNVLVSSSEAAKLRWRNPELKSKMISATKATTSTPEVRNKMSVASKEVNARPDVKIKKSIASKANWQDPVYRAKVIANSKAAKERLALSEKEE